MQFRFRCRIEVQREQERGPLGKRLDVGGDSTNLLRNLARQLARVEQWQERAEADHEEDDSPVDLEHALSEAHGFSFVVTEHSAISNQPSDNRRIFDSGTES